MSGELEAQAHGPLKVVIAGGGVAGLEALLALSALGGRTRRRRAGEPQRRVRLPAAAGCRALRQRRRAEDRARAHRRRRRGASHQGRAGLGRPGARTVTTASGDTLAYDALLIALGANPVEAVPGALTFSGEAERRRFAELLATLGRRGMRRLAFVVPPAATWSIAAYELALLTAAERDARRLQGVEITLVTHEAAPLDLFGPAASQLVAARLEEAGVSLRLSSRAERFEDGRLHLAGGESLTADAAVALPALEVPPLPGLPQRQNGFVQTDTAMHVDGLEAVWAAGDATWFPIKQGGLAAQQADVCRAVDRGPRRGPRPDRGLSAGAAGRADHGWGAGVFALVDGRARRGCRVGGPCPVVASDEARRHISGSLHRACARRGPVGGARGPRALDRSRPDAAEHERRWRSCWRQRTPMRASATSRARSSGFRSSSSSTS